MAETPLLATTMLVEVAQKRKVFATRSLQAKIAPGEASSSAALDALLVTLLAILVVEMLAMDAALDNLAHQSESRMRAANAVMMGKCTALWR